MLFVSLRDLQWRRRRFLIGVLAAGLVFALALVITGISGSFRNEASRTVSTFRVDRWVISSKDYGPFTASNLLPTSEAAKIAALPGVKAVSPVDLLQFTASLPEATDMNLIGIVPGRLGEPVLHEGRQLRNSNEIVVDRSLGMPLGRVLRIGDLRVRVVGRTRGITYFGGTPTVWMSLHDVQHLELDGVPLASAFLVRGTIARAPAGLRVLDDHAVVSDLRRPLDMATQTIDLVRIVLWIVSAGIIGSVLYLQTLERTRDFAVFKAIGVTSRSLLVGMAVQAIALSLLAAAAATLIARLLEPLMPLHIEIGTAAYAALPVVAVVVGLVSCVVGLRRAVAVDPALAFGGS